MNRTIVCGLLSVSLLTFGQLQGATTVWQDGFETGISSSAAGTTPSFTAGSNLTLDTAANPSGVGSVLRYTDKASTAEWGSEVRAATGSIANGAILLSTYSATPGIATFTFTYDYYIPSSTVAVNDQFGVMLRFTSGTTSTGSSQTSSQLLLSDSVLRDQWVTATFTGTIPALTSVAEGSVPVMYVTPMLIWNDRASSSVYNPAGLLGYVDNVSFAITPEPNRMVLLGFAGIGLLMRRKRV